MAGLLPFFGAAGGALAGEPAALPALLAYGAIILAFLGAVHWGLALRATAAEAAATPARLTLGVVPSLLGWVALLLPAAPGLVLLAASLLATAAAETIATRRGLLPASYLRLRWTLTLGASAALLGGALAA